MLTTTLLLLVAGMKPAGAPCRAIIDVHLHAYTTDRFRPPTPDPITRIVPKLRSAEEHMQATLRQMRIHHVVAGIVSNDGVPVEALDPWRASASSGIIPSPYFEGSEGSPLPPIDELRREYLAGRFKVMGEIGAQYGGMSLDDPRLEPYFALAEELDIPVGVHTGISFPGTPYLPCCHGFRARFGKPLALEEVLIRHPRLRIYLMHAGAPYLEETIALMKVYPQVYADVAVIDWIIPRREFYPYLRVLMNAGLGERIMFGSDQMMWPDAIGRAIETIESAPFLSEQEKRNIFFANAVRFLRLPEVTAIASRACP